MQLKRLHSTAKDNHDRAHARATELNQRKTQLEQEGYVYFCFPHLPFKVEYFCPTNRYDKGCAA